MKHRTMKVPSCWTKPNPSSRIVAPVFYPIRNKRLFLKQVEKCIRKSSCRPCCMALFQREGETTSGATVKEIWRVENAELWKRYLRKRIEFEEKYKQISSSQLAKPHLYGTADLDAVCASEGSSEYKLKSEINERFLLYGGTGAEIRKIITEGFVIKDAKTERSRHLGKGIYMTGNNNRSLNHRKSKSYSITSILP